MAVHTANPEPRFWQRRSVHRMLIGLAWVGVIVVLGTLGYVAMGWSAVDALYMVVITISGVGYGEVRPMASTPERIHTMIVIALGIVAMAYTVAGFLQFLTEGEIR